MTKVKLAVKAVLLDLDGTLVNSTDAYLEAAKAGFAAIRRKQFNAKLTFEIARRYELGKPLDNLVNQITAEKALVKKFMKVYLDTYYNSTITKTKPFPNVPETLRKLSAKFPIAIVTMRHTTRENVMKELERLGFAKFFKALVTALDCEKPKPSPDALLIAAERLSVQISNCAMVGDSVADVQAGKIAGAKTVAVLSGLFSEEELRKEKPDLIIENVNHLPRFLIW